MKVPVSIQLAALALVLTACAASPQRQQSMLDSSGHGAVLRTVSLTEGATVLLVSLDDGSVIMQHIDVGADLCFKQNSSSSTTCLTRGEPMFDPVSQEMIGFHMVEEKIKLVAQTN